MVQASNSLTSSVQALTLNRGLHLVAVTSASPLRMANAGDMMLPAIHVGIGPGIPGDSVELLPGPRNHGHWLFDPRDMLVIKVLAPQAVVLLTTLRTGAMQPMTVEVTRLDRRQQSPAQQRAPALAAADAARALPASPARRGALRMRIDLHIQNRGDVSYADNFWAGALGEGLAIEGFVLTVLEGVGIDDIEYMAMNEVGAESDWVIGGRLCGTRGAAMALIGFAVRLRGEAAMSFTVEYRGSFSSGRVLGPLADGVMCQAGPGERLEAIEVLVTSRAAAMQVRNGLSADAADGLTDDPTQKITPPAPRQTGPRFSVFRENVE